MQINDETNKLQREDVFDHDINTNNFNTEISMSDFIKMDEKRVVFISTEGSTDSSNRKLHILFFHFSDDYKNMKMRRYSYDIGNYIFIKEISASFFNNYLVFDATTIVKKDNMGDDDKVNYFSLFMIFGYPNGTIITKDITKILSGSANYDSSINFVNFLYEDIVIDNNIFGYIPDDKTIITSIPNEISIINPIDETPIEANTIIYNSQNYAIK